MLYKPILFHTLPSLKKLNRSFTKSSFKLFTNSIDGKRDLFGHDGQAELYMKYRPRYNDDITSYIKNKCASQDVYGDFSNSFFFLFVNI